MCFSGYCRYVLEVIQLAHFLTAALGTMEFFVFHYLTQTRPFLLNKLDYAFGQGCGVGVGIGVGAARSRGNGLGVGVGVD